jgi:hypothetical protein
MFLEQFVLTAAKVFKEFLTVDGLHPAAFQIVIAAVEHVPRLRKLIKVSLDNILHKFVGISASALRGEVLELLFRLGREVYFHTLQDTEKPAPGQRQKIRAAAALGKWRGLGIGLRIAKQRPEPFLLKMPVVD